MRAGVTRRAADRGSDGASPCHLVVCAILSVLAPLALAQGAQRAKVSAVLNQTAVAPGQDDALVLAITVCIDHLTD